MNLAQVFGSLLAILATAGVVAWLGLGRNGRIEDPSRLAEQLLSGFDSEEAFPDSGGRAALVRGRDGSWALLRLHGLHPVARRFAQRPQLSIVAGSVHVASGERLLGDTEITNDKLLTLV